MKGTYINKKFCPLTLLLIKNIITVVVRNLSFVLEIPYSEYDNIFLVKRQRWNKPRNLTTSMSANIVQTNAT